MKRLFYILIPAVLLMTSSLAADTVVLRNGQSIIGRIVNQTQTTVIMETDTGRRTLQKSQIRRISYGDPGAEKAAEERRKAEEARLKAEEEEAGKKRSESELKKTVAGQIILNDQLLEKRSEEESALLKEEEEFRRKVLEKKNTFLFFRLGKIQWTPVTRQLSYNMRYLSRNEDLLFDKFSVSQALYSPWAAGDMIEIGLSREGTEWDYSWSLRYTQSAVGPGFQGEKQSYYNSFESNPPGNPYYLTTITEIGYIFPSEQIQDLAVSFNPVYLPFRKSKSKFIKNAGIKSNISLIGQLSEQKPVFQFTRNKVYSNSTDDFFRNMLTSEYGEIGLSKSSAGWLEISPGLYYSLRFSPYLNFDAGADFIFGKGDLRYDYEHSGIYKIAGIELPQKKKFSAEGKISVAGSSAVLGYRIDYRKFGFRFFYSKSYRKISIDSLEIKNPDSGFNYALFGALLSGNLDSQDILLSQLKLKSNYPETLQEENTAGFEFSYRFN